MQIVRFKYFGENVIQANELHNTTAGEVFQPTSEGFAEEVSGYQTAFHNHPSVVIVAENAQDVSSAINYARHNNLAIAVQATGHGRQKTEKNGLLINTKRMNKIAIDAKAKTVEIAAGVQWGQVVQKAATYGLAPLSGSSPGVGAISYTLGGGVGILGRQFGYTADHVHWIEVVTADGEIKKVSKDNNADLFWALRGAGANFGVVTKIKVDLIPLTNIYGGGMYFDSHLVLDALQTYTEWTRSVPEELTSSICAYKLPNLPMFPQAIRGRYVAHLRFAYNGDECQGEKLIEPLRAIGPRLIDTVQDMPFINCGEIHNDPPMPHAYYGNNLLLKDIDEAVIQALFKSSSKNTADMFIVEIRHLGGALSRSPKVSNAVGHRDAEYLARILSPIEADRIKSIKEEHQRFFGAIEHLAIGRQLNFIYGEEGDSDCVKEAYSEGDYQRLKELKNKYDSNNMFRLNYNIN